MSNQVRSVSVRLSMNIADYVRGARQAKAETDTMATGMERRVAQTQQRTQRNWDTMGRYGGRTALVIGGGFAFAEKKLLSFDKQMSAVNAATNANARTQEKLRSAAIIAGRDTAFSATEAAQGITELGKAGVTTKDILSGGLRGALDLAAAGQINVGEAAEYTATALNEFEIGGNKARHVADLLAAGAGKAQGEVSDMALALTYVGVPAHQAGVSIEETAGTIALLAKNGVIGERAGTSLRGMLASLTSPSKIAAKEMKKYGIEVFDAKGQFLGFEGVAATLHNRLKGLTQQERLNALGRIFGNEQLQAANILYDKGAKGVRQMTGEVNDQGYATETANKKLDNLAGDWERFTGSLETAIIGAGSPAQAGLRELVQSGEAVVNAFHALPDEVQIGIVKVAALTAGLGATFYAIAKIRGVARDFRGLPRGATSGGLGGAASLAAPVPVFVTNAGGLGGLAGGRGGSTVLAPGGTTVAGGKIRGFRLPRGTGIVATAAGLALMATGVTSKTHTGSTVGGAVAGGQFFGPVGAAVGGAVGSANDIKNAGNEARDVIKAAREAIDHGDLKAQQAALKGLVDEANKLATGGGSQNFARFVTEVTGRRKEMEELAEALHDLTTTAPNAAASLKYLLGGGPRPKAPGGPTFPKSLLDLSTGRAPHTTGNPLADLWGLKKLGPSPVMDLVNGLIPKGAKAGAVKKGKNGTLQLMVSMGLDTKEFRSKSRDVRNVLEGLTGVEVEPTVDLNDGPARAKISSLKDALRGLTAEHYSVGIQAYANIAGLGGKKNPADGGTIGKDGLAWGGTVMGQRHPYGDKVLKLLAPGEEVITNRHGQADKWRPFLKAINGGLAEGGTVGSGSPGRYQAGAGVTVYFPAPSVLTAAMRAADRIAADAVKVKNTQKDERERQLNILYTLQRINDLKKQMQARDEKGRLELVGLDRRVAKADLGDAKAQLWELRNQRKQALADARKDAIATLRETRNNERDQLRGTLDIFSRSATPAGAINSVNRQIADISAYGQVLARLKGAGASPALLRQLVARADQGDFRSAIRLGKALLAQPASLRQLNAALGTLNTVTSSVATMTTDPRFLGSGAWHPTSVKAVQVNVGLDPSRTLQDLRRIITHEVTAALQKAGA